MTDQPDAPAPAPAVRYSPASGGFYLVDLSTSIPDDAVDVADADYQALIAAQAKGATIRAGAGGAPEAVAGDGATVDLARVAETPSYVAVRAPTLAQQAATALAASSDAMWDEYGCMGVPVPAEWSTYLRALRAIATGTDTASNALPARPAAAPAA